MFAACSALLQDLTNRVVGPIHGLSLLTKRTFCQNCTLYKDVVPIFYNPSVNWRFMTGVLDLPHLGKNLGQKSRAYRAIPHYWAFWSMLPRRTSPCASAMLTLFRC